MKAQKKPQRGRPLMPVGVAKIGVFTMRLSDDERALLDAAAMRAGKKPTSWAREILLRAAMIENP
jgi:uncharacterized protein (DUF1778 family)